MLLTDIDFQSASWRRAYWSVE
ncbi:hypothetical protein LQQ63_26420 (plasmid) [Escherichia coli]|nr:hypothetical protein LQQ63_26420 [Escherichia coli]